ncbi:hypothetical protein QE152_g11018 [Popillia japonica]|uniref:Uncharacterized protein n=1 Tax=Popillia japonica TaxID=7064 RepID=A0AAW1LST6_POPJA
MAYYEKEQARLFRLWEEVEAEDPYDNEKELANEDDIMNERSSDSESEQDADTDEDIMNERSSDSESEQDADTDEEVSSVTNNLPSRDPSFVGKHTIWGKHCAPKNNRTKKANIVFHLPGVRGTAKAAKTIKECWSLFFSDDMFQII